MLSGALAAALAVACAGRSTKDGPAGSADRPTCSNLATVTGPEDLVVDAPGAPYRLLVSSRDIDHPSDEDGIFSVPLDEPGPTVAATRLPLVARDDCSFHPHGISLVQAEHGRGGGPDAPWLLYVINHHDPEDTSPAGGCVRGAEPGKKLVSIEVFRVEPSRLIFIQRLAEPSILTNANDLVALPDGQVWITNPPPTTFGVLREGLLGHGDSKVVHFDCGDPDTPSLRRSLRCPDGAEHWSVAWDGGRFVNGIEYARRTDGSMDRVYVASSAGGVIHRLRVTTTGQLERAECPIEIQGMPDNLTWLDPDHRTLLVAVHTNPRRFLQHSRRHQVRSPSRVVAIDGLSPPDDVKRRVLFNDDGHRLSGASSAACVDGDLVLGQVFGPHVLRCRDVADCRAAERAAPRGEASE